MRMVGDERWGTTDTMVQVRTDLRHEQDDERENHNCVFLCRSLGKIESPPSLR